MARKKRQRHGRIELAWCVLGFVVVQALLSVAVEFFWPIIRDPEFGEMEEVLRARLAEAPGRPLVLALGSSRTLLGLRADLLNDPGNPNGPLVINAAVTGSGPMMHQVALRRILNAGIRPRQVIVEVMPMSYSRQGKSPLEEGQIQAGRLCWQEIASILPYYEMPSRTLWRWAKDRLLPCYRHQAELRKAMEIDLPSGGPGPARTCRNSHGWVGWEADPAKRAALTQANLRIYANALTDPALAPGPFKALRDLVQLCRKECIDVVLVAPPENKDFRSFQPAAEENQLNGLRQFAAAMDVALVDARAWVDDDGFTDGHHMSVQGAVQYTERLGREVRFVSGPRDAGTPSARLSPHP